MFRALVVFFMLTQWMPHSLADTLSGPVDAEVLKVIDGDTIRVRALIWVDQTVEVSVRLRSINTPELYSPQCAAEKVKAQQARNRVAAFAPVGSKVKLTAISLDKYGGRVVANIDSLDGKSLSGILLDEGTALPYGTAKPWCEIKRGAR